MQQQRAAAEAQQASLLQAFFPGAPMVDMLPTPALGLLTSALAVPGMLLGSLLETNALPDLGTSATAPSTTGEYIQPSAVPGGEHVFLKKSHIYDAKRQRQPSGFTPVLSL
jgi:hypothetical protein